MTGVVIVSRARNGIHKFTATFPDGAKVHFGRKGYSDYTIHGDYDRMKRYLVRHARREKWGRSGAKTAGFWSRWLLWSKPSLEGARRQTEKVLGKKILLR
jgi:hypothetical protein